MLPAVAPVAAPTGQLAPAPAGPPPRVGGAGLGGGGVVRAGGRGVGVGARGGVCGGWVRVPVLILLRPPELSLGSVSSGWAMVVATPLVSMMAPPDFTKAFVRPVMKAPPEAEAAVTRRTPPLKLKVLEPSLGLVF